MTGMPAPAGRLHHVGQRVDEGVVAAAHVLKVVDDGVEPLEVLGLRGQRVFGLPVEADDRETRRGIRRLGHGFHVLRFAPHAVLGREQSQDAKTPVADEAVDQMAPAGIDRGRMRHDPQAGPAREAGGVSRRVEERFEACAHAAHRAHPTMPFVIYFCIDCEASGPVLRSSIFFRSAPRSSAPRTDGTFWARRSTSSSNRSFPDSTRGHGRLRPDADHLRRSGTEPKEALTRLARFVADENAGSADAPCFVGHNAVFDWSHIAYYYAHFGMDNPFGYKGLDTKSLAMGRLGISWRDTSKENLERMLELPPQDPRRSIARTTMRATRP